jgi:hypothetical protein
MHRPAKVYLSDNITEYHKGIGFEDVYWIHLAQDRDRRQAVVNAMLNLPVP